MWLSLTPSPPPVDFTASDKVGHLLAYALLMFWFCRLYRSRKLRTSYGAAFLAMGIGLEFLQGLLGYRSAEALDMAANSIGVAAGWGAALILPRA